MKQAARAFLMVEPTTFGFNDETAGSNFFQRADGTRTPSEINRDALNEFQEAVARLKTVGIPVYVMRNPAEYQLPDAIFPNNWISFMQDGTLIIYPMLAPNRRKEKNTIMLSEIAGNTSFTINRILDLSKYEMEDKFLEGTGSVVFDHINKIAFASLSPRTHPDVFEFLCNELNYKPFTFRSYDKHQKEVYHTNVVMTITSSCVILCSESVKNPEERRCLTDHFIHSNRAIIEISLDQMEQFAGNMLEVDLGAQKSGLILSETALHSLSEKQVKTLENNHQIIVLKIPTIEKIGGGSARCMLAEIFATTLLNH